MSDEKNISDELRQQVMGLSSLVQLENKSRQVETIQEFGFFVTNETRRLLDYHQASFFLRRSKKLSLRNISGVPNFEKNAPHVRWLKNMGTKFLKKLSGDTPQIISADNLPKKLQTGWAEWSSAAGVWCPMHINGKLLGGLWLSRDQPWQEAELGLLNQLCTSYAYSLHALKVKPRWWNPHFEFHLGKALVKIIFFVLLAIVLFLPVHLSVLAPAKISPIDPFVVSSPLKGVIKKVHVQPNQEIKEGDPLFTLDDTELRNRHNVAAKALDVIQAEYKNSRQKSLLHTDKGSNTDLLKAKIERKQAEVDFASEELSFVEVQAARSGIVLFNDINNLVGKPVVIGEKILTLADPFQHEIEIHVPVDNAINLDPGTKVRLFLNVAPNIEITGTIRQTSYEAEITEENILAFLVKARISSEEPLRIGLRGTAKIFGNQVPLYYYLFRRPLAGIRQFLGL